MSDEILEKISQDERIRELELAREKFWRDYHSGLSAAEQRGRRQGFKEGGIKALILDNLEEKKTEEQIVEKLVKHFSLSKEDTKLFYEKYNKC